MNPTDECFLFLQGRRWPCVPGDVLGRAGTVALDVLRPVEVLSRRHLQIQHSDGRWQVVALPEAHNETFIDGRPMRRGTPYPLNGMRALQDDTFQFHLGTADGASTQVWADPPSSIDVPVARSASSVPRASDPSATSGLDGLPGAVVETDVRLNVIATNRAAMRLLGNSAKGRDLDEWTSEPTRLRDQLLRLREGETAAPADVAFNLPAGPHAIEVQASRLEASLLVFLRDVTEERTRHAEGHAHSLRLARRIEILAELSLARAFHEGDVATSLTLLTHRAAPAMECRRISAWLVPDGAPAGSRKVVCQVCHDTQAPAASGAAVDLAYCPAFFDALATPQPWASEVDGSPVIDLLRDIGFVPRDTRSVLCVGLQHAGKFHGLLSFERTENERPWTLDDRHFALCLASFAVLARQTLERREVMAQLEQSQGQMTRELEEANRYVQRILPEPIVEGPIRAEWIMQPSEALGGDSFGYHWVGDLFVVYILDVVGHGTGMALLSISVLNNIRARLLLGEAAMADPAGVLRDLNTAFPMENQNNMLFSLWYGVFDRRTRRLTYASAGHPPALLLRGEVPDDGEDYAALGTEGPSIGAMDGVEFTSASIDVEPGSKLFVYSDGAFEIPVGPNREWTFDEFVAVVRSTRYMSEGEPAYLRKRVGALCSLPRIPDDFTIVRISFES